MVGVLFGGQKAIWKSVITWGVSQGSVLTGSSFLVYNVLDILLVYWLHMKIL